MPNLCFLICRGVVQLFNAVRKHQRNVEEKAKEAGSSDRKRAKLISSVSKRDFINVLRGMEGTEVKQNAIRKSLKSKQVGPISCRQFPLMIKWAIIVDIHVVLLSWPEISV